MRDVVKNQAALVESEFLFSCLSQFKDMSSCASRRVKELYMDTGNVICIPDDSLPYETPGFPNYKEHAKKDDELDKQAKDFERVFAESSLHSKLSHVLQTKVKYFFF
jgi:hypothetical protein